MNNFSAFFTSFYRSPIPQHVVLLLVSLAGVSLAFSGEIELAAKNGDLERVKALLKGHPDGELHDAAKDSNLETVKALLKGHPDLVSSKDNQGYTPLHVAALFNRKEVADFLLANKAYVHVKDKLGQTPLHLAGGYEVAELLLAHDARITAKDARGLTPLHVAAAAGHKDVVTLLLNKGASVHAKDDTEGWTPLHMAASGGYKDVAELLLAKKAEVDVRGKSRDTPLHLVGLFRTGNRYEVAELLLAQPV